MTKWQRIKNILGALVMIACAVLMALIPDLGRILIVLLLGISTTLRGLRKFIYYFTMARFMVGGKTILYQGVLLMDFGLFTIGVADIPGSYVMIYLLAGYLFYGAIDIMRALEIKKAGTGSWRFKLLIGIGNLALGALCIAELRSVEIMVYIYCLGMVWSAVGRIVDSFRKNAVLYVQ